MRKAELGTVEQKASKLYLTMGVNRTSNFIRHEIIVAARLTITLTPEVVFQSFKRKSV